MEHIASAQAIEAGPVSIALAETVEGLVVLVEVDSVGLAIIAKFRCVTGDGLLSFRPLTPVDLERHGKSKQYKAIVEKIKNLVESKFRQS